MSAFKKGDLDRPPGLDKAVRVLVERFVLQPEADGYIDVGCHEGVVPVGTVHQDPPVPVEDLVEELELLWYYTGRLHSDHPEHAKELRRLRGLKAARLAAKDPVPSGTEKAWHEEMSKYLDIDQRIAKALERIAEHLAGPVPQGTPDPTQRYEPTEQALSLATLPGEQVAVAIIDLLKTMWVDMTPTQKETWNDWLIEDQAAWRKFWKVGV